MWQQNLNVAEKGHIPHMMGKIPADFSPADNCGVQSPSPNGESPHDYTERLY